MNRDEREEFARAVVALARKHKVHSVAMQYRDGFDGPLQGQHTVTWSEGRHGVANRINLSYSDYHEIPEAALATIDQKERGDG